MRKPILKTPGIEADYALFPMSYPWAWSSYKTMISNFWVPEEIAMGPDMAVWHSSELTEEERHLFLTVFAQLTTFDLLRTADLSQRLIPLLQAPELVHVLTVQSMQECVHTASYQHIIETLGLPQDDIYQRYRHLPALNNRVKLAEKFGDLNLDDKPGILRALIHFYCLFEGVWFLMNLLGPVQSLARRGLMKCTAEQFQYITRDEQSHVAIGLNFIRDFMVEYPEAWTDETKRLVISDSEEALQLEEAFIRYALPRPILGYNADDHILTARHYAERWLSRIGLDYSFGGEHRIPWMDEMVATKKEKNFFETRVTEYQIGTLKFEDDEDDGFGSVLR